MFVKMKTDELRRKLDHIAKITERLGARPPPSGAKKISAKRLERYAGTEEQAIGLVKDALVA
jgi:hypothetical protein